MAPQRSATGGALLASDPHLEVNRLPAIWYEAELHWEDEYVLGATLPGCPLFAVARTRDLAWGVTYLKGDTSDYFIEDCRQRTPAPGSIAATTSGTTSRFARRRSSARAHAPR